MHITRIERRFGQGYSRINLYSGICMLLKTVRFTLIVSLLSLGGCVTAPERDWSKITRADILAAYEHTLASHPGAVDPQNRQFAATALRARDKALTLSEQVTAATGYRAVLQAYSANFRDGHYAVYALREKLGVEAGYLWPGIYLAWRDNTVLVSYSRDDQMLLHAALVQCDGIAAEQLVRNNVFAFDIGKPDQPSYWARVTSDVFLDGGNPFIRRPSECVFNLKSGGSRKVTLSWEPLPRERLRELARQAQFGSTPEPGVRMFGKGRYWINLPDFSPADDMLERMTATIEQLGGMREELRAADTLVFDMRGNQGGNSRWGVRAIEAVWGADYRESRKRPNETFVDWRVSKGNIDHAAFIVDFLTERGDDEAVAYFSPIAEGLTAAKKGQNYFREPESNEAVGAAVENPVDAKVLLLTHGVCASSCLDFVDEMMRLENVTQIGYPTGSDTQYMEVRQINLPSGFARMVLPVKVYRNRARAANEYYDPAYRYDGLDWSDDALQEWVTTMVLPILPEDIELTHPGD